MLIQLKLWLKQEQSPLARTLFRLAKKMMQFEIPNITPVAKLLLSIHLLLTGLWGSFVRVFYWTPLFKSRIEHGGERLYLYGGMPYISGPLSITVGVGSRMSGQTTFSARTTVRKDGIQPRLEIGSNVDVGWQTTIAVGTLVKIGDNVRLAGRHFLAGYPGHPIDATARAEGLPCLDNQSGDIILEDDVWLATGACVMAGVRIGRGTIVGAGAVVTQDLPPYVLAAGVPAKVIKTLPQAREVG